MNIAAEYCVTYGGELLKGLFLGFIGGYTLSRYIPLSFFTSKEDLENNEDEIADFFDKLSIVWNNSFSDNNPLNGEKEKVYLSIISDHAKSIKNLSETSKTTKGIKVEKTKKAKSSPKDLEVKEINQTSTTQDELASIFEEEQQRQNRSLQEKLDVGRKVGKEPVNYHAKKGGGYVTVNEIQTLNNRSHEFQKKKLSRADELDIMHTFSNIRGMTLLDARDFVKKEGYSLRPIYINSGSKIQGLAYDATVIGISVEDKNYDLITEKFSKNAKISDIIDIGGLDTYDRGKISLD